ncbi:uncharacterized protein N7515_004590 [Penicillium bovifimosum]|uniref:RING-type domain-containing protein n=1 Tax=Penicillium bovifimosum TaxID=126998 RepID=A0A9W9H0D8_9EURO|nr:uncharacterized protein N7515_004590 [Penicillium bovifimosum]KAJ5135312.1 hypothetical protein N7515_004590 [Penicillium bovifimosum]
MSVETHQPTPLDPISEFRVWQALTVFYTALLNRQIRRRWTLEKQCMENKPLSEWFRPLIFLESTPTLRKPCGIDCVCKSKSTSASKSKSTTTSKSSSKRKSKRRCLTTAAVRERAILLRARVEKGKELASEIERRMQRVPAVRFPTHFCHTCVQDGESVEVLLTTCGHRVCRTCLEFGVDEQGVYCCSICFVVTGFVAPRGRGIERGLSEGSMKTPKEVGMGIKREEGARSV